MRHAVSPSQKLIEWMEHTLRHERPGTRLPRLRDLAARFALSERSVRLMIRPYVRMGKLCTVRGKGTFVAPLEPAVPSQSAENAPRRSVDSLVEALSRGISDGTFRRGEALPPVKAISLQHKLTARTVSAAYRRLASMGRVHRLGKRYWVGGLGELGTGMANREIHILTPNADFRNLFHQSYLSQAYQAMEQELVSCGSVLHFHSVDDFPWLISQWRARQLPRGVVLAQLAAQQSLHIQATLLRVLRELGDGSCQVLLTGKVPKGLNRRYHYVSDGNIPTARARAVASHAADGGYCGVRVFINFDFCSPYRTLELFRILPEVRHRIPGTPVHYELLFQERKLSSHEALEAVLRTTGHEPGYLRGVLSKFEGLAPGQLAQTIGCASGLSPRLGSAPEDELWVFADDRDAAGALRWCRDHRRAVPSHAGILGIQNNPAFFHLGISSLVPDWRAIGYLMAHSLLADIEVAKSRRGYLRTKFLMLRRTSTR